MTVTPGSNDCPWSADAVVECLREIIEESDQLADAAVSLDDEHPDPKHSGLVLRLDGGTFFVAVTRGR